jgi:hypothetical protein
MLVDAAGHSDLKFIDKMNLFFIDYGLIPLMVYDNYLAAWKQNRSPQCISTMAEQADLMSVGDMLNKPVFID